MVENPPNLLLGFHPKLPLGKVSPDSQGGRLYCSLLFLETPPFPVGVDGGQAAVGRGSWAAVSGARRLWPLVVQCQWCFPGGGACGGAPTWDPGRRGLGPQGVWPSRGSGERSSCLAAGGPALPMPAQPLRAARAQLRSPGALSLTPEPVAPQGLLGAGGFPRKTRVAS